MLDENSLRALPTAELHRHLDGSVRLATVADLARRHGLGRRILARHFPS